MLTRRPVSPRLLQTLIYHPHRPHKSISTSTPSPKMSSPPKLKILMLHGFTQSGPLFHSKTRALEKTLQKAFPRGVSLIYPTGPIALYPADLPGFSIKDAQGEERDAWGWWKKDDSSGAYTGLEKGLSVIRDAVREAGGVDGVVGFSQGGCAAALVAALLEPGRKAAFENYREKVPGALEYPEGWEELREEFGGLKFAVSYSGFWAPDERYGGFYEPEISTPVLHFVGSLDSVVEEGRTMGLVERCVGGKERVVMHPGGHFVPVGKDMAGVLVGFMRGVFEEKKEEVGVEDMDVPF